MKRAKKVSGSSRLYLIIKRKGARFFQGAVPAKPGVTRTRLMAAIRGRINKGYIVKIVTGQQLKAYIKKIALKARSMTRSVKRRRVVKRRSPSRPVRRRRVVKRRR